MRPASVGPVKSLIRRIDLCALRALLDAARDEGVCNLRPVVAQYLARASA